MAISPPKVLRLRRVRAVRVSQRRQGEQSIVVIESGVERARARARPAATAPSPLPPVSSHPEWRQTAFYAAQFPGFKIPGNWGARAGCHLEGCFGGGERACVRSPVRVESTKDGQGGTGPEGAVRHDGR